VGFNEGKENCIEIKLSYRDDSLEFSCFNTKDSYMAVAAANASGLGIANAKRRLELLYPGRHRLDIANNDRDYSVTLTLQSV
jgi:LytS/YehU family sensor histidine kinase